MPEVQPERLVLSGQGEAVAYKSAAIYGPTWNGEACPGYLVVQDGKIVDVFAADRLQAMTRMLDLGDASIMPGIVAADHPVRRQRQGDHSLGARPRAFDSYDPWMGEQGARAGHHHGHLSRIADA